MENTSSKEVLASVVRFDSLIDYIRFHISLIAVINGFKLTDRELLILSCAVYLTIKYGYDVDIFRGKYFNELLKMSGLSSALVRSYLTMLRNSGFVVRDENGENKVIREFIPDVKDKKIFYIIKAIIDENNDKATA